MLRMQTWKVILIISICICSLYFAIPTLLSDNYNKKLHKYLPDSRINLGLDLKGGVSLVLEVDFNLYYKEQINNTLDIMRKSMFKDGIKYKSISLNQELSNDNITIINIEFYDNAELYKKNVLNIARNAVNFNQIEININERIAPNLLQVKIPQTMIEEMRQNLVAQSIEIVRKRVDEAGTKEIEIQRQGREQILLQVPGIYDTTEIRRLIGQTAKLTFHYVNNQVSPKMNAGQYIPFDTTLLPMMESNDNKKDYNKNNKLNHSDNSDNVDNGDNLNNSNKFKFNPNKQFLAIKIKPAMMGDAIANANSSMQDGQYVVTFKLTNIGAKIFADITMKHVGNMLAIVLDDTIISSPTINQPIIGGSGIISGNFTSQSSSELALLLRAGALPAPLKIVEERTVGPTLGQDSINSGTNAVIIASISVMVFMVLFYSFWGIFANIGLIFNIITMIAVLGIIGATLTLPGLAGIALTLGMAIDANVLIYERMREEYNKGATTLMAIESGYRLSFATILDSNITTIAVAIILYIFGSGPIKGFAVSLIVGILCSLFTAMSLTKMLIVIWYRVRKPTMLGL